jgi:hypothetical protein
MLFSNKKLNHLFLTALIVAFAIPVLNIFLIYPHFSAVQINNVEDSAIRLAHHMEARLKETGDWQLILNGDEEPSDINDSGVLNSYILNFGLLKLKIFSTQGVVVYSTDESNIGELNRNDYFHSVVAKGGTYSKLVRKQSSSLEGQTYQRDVVELYVPSMQNDKFNGAFELYYDVTQRIESLDRLVVSASILPFVVSSFLSLILYWGMKNLDRSLMAQDKAEKEIETLQGIIPICMHCKKIRDDNGDWSQLEKYIMDRSDAKFSHGLCEKCANDKYGRGIES